MRRRKDLWTQAHDQAQCYLRRYSDSLTKAHREDMVQEAAFAAWRWARAARHPQRFWAAVRTIATRVRRRTLRDPWPAQLAEELEAVLAIDAEPRDERHFVIAGRFVPVDRAGPCLRQALERLGPLDRQLLLSFHEGFCCAELAARFHRSEPCVKTRLHRARRRVQRDVEACVRTAGDLDS